MSKEKRQRRQAKRQWQAIDRELKDLEYECARLLNIYFDDDEVREKIKEKYADKMIELKVKRNLLKDKMED